MRTLRATCALIGALFLLPAVPAHAQNCTETEERGDPRPILSGPVQTLATTDGRFLVHWTEEGEDTPSNLGDADANGRPDVIDRALEGLVRGDLEFPQAGYRAVPADALGVDGAIDVFLLDLPVNGYAFQVPAVDGTDGGSSCTIQLDGGLGSSLDGILESVAAHEFHHCTQYAHTTLAPSWLLESTATYEQYRLYSTPALLAAVEVLWITRLREPERALDSLGGRYEYAGFVFELFWRSLQGDDPSRLPALWDALRASGADWEDALEVESQRVFGQPFPQTFLDFATWNAFACDRSDGEHYDPSAFPCELETAVPVQVVTDRAEFVLPDVSFASAYREVLSDGATDPVELLCDPLGGERARARVRLLSLDRFGRILETSDGTGRDDGPLSVRLSGPVDGDGSVLVVFASTGRAPIDVSCSITRVDPVDPDLPDSDGSGCECGGGSALWLLGLLALGPKRRRRRA